VPSLRKGRSCAAWRTAAGLVKINCAASKAPRNAWRAASASGIGCSRNAGSNKGVAPRAAMARRSAPPCAAARSTITVRTLK
jgi:hypothetical protein